uniref:hypothetical protein n=1 Tax=Flavobacterium sp. TaxID=239 RepID=UPI003753BE0D
KLVDQIFQYQLSKPKEKLNSKDFLEKPLDNNWFIDGTEEQTLPGFGFDSLIIDDENRLALFCIGGTQTVKVNVKIFNSIIEKNNIGYEAIVIIQYLDTFGVSESDYTKELKFDADTLNIVKYNYRGGVMAQWVLQHQYGYNPFNDYLTYSVNMKRKWKI